MPWLREIVFRLRALLRRPRLEQDMDEELRFHLEMQTRQNVAAGMAPEAARAAAWHRFGGLEQIKEECREQHGIPWLETFWQDVRFAGRMLRKHPGFTAVVVFTLALGIGANTAIFSVVHAVLLRPLPFSDPDRLVMLWEQNPAAGIEQEQVTGGNIDEWRSQATSFESMGYLWNVGPWSRNLLLESDGPPVRLRGRYGSSGFFEVFGVAPLLGRTFTPEEDLPGSSGSAVLSYALWQRQFAADPQVLGRSLDVFTGFGHRASYTIVGVMPAGFRLPPDVDVWISWSSERALQQAKLRRDRNDLWVFARLRPGVSAESAGREMSLIQSRIAAAHPEAPRMGTQVKAVPLLEQVIGSSTRPALLALLGAVAFVLLIACANVANLLLARAGARHKEIAVRIALGAGRRRILRQLLTESVLLSLCGGALGLLLAVWGIQALGAMAVDDTFRGVKEFRIERIHEVSLDVQVLAFTLLVSLATGVVFGLAPALHAVKVDLNESLKEEGRSASAGAARGRLHNLLLVAEVAVALVLLVGAGVMLQSFVRMQQIDPGVQATGVVKFEVDRDLAARKYPGEITDVTDELLERIRALPGIVAVGAAGEMPLIKSGWQEPLVIEGAAHSAEQDRPTIDLRIVTPELFRAMGVPLLHGRDLSKHDRTESRTVCLINQALAARFFPNQNPVGRRIALRTLTNSMEIVGVVGDVRHFGRDGEVRPEVYQSYRQSYWGGAELGPTFVVRTTLDPSSAVAAIRREIEGPGRAAPMIGKVQTIRDVLGSSVAAERLRSTLIGLFAAVALVLASVGIYGVMSWTVARRTHEIGIRMALGADPARVRRMIAWQGLKLTLCGIALGLAGAYAVTRFLASQLYGVAAIEPMSYVAVPVLLTSVALLACYVPARRATRIDPALALRHE